MNHIDITLTRRIAAPPEKIFDRWLDANAPGGPWFGTQERILNPIVGGLFFHAVDHEGKRWPHYGRFVRLDRPHFIEHTWVSEATKGCETVVTLALEPDGDETLVTLRQTGVPDDALGRQHEQGWTWMLSSLDETLTSENR